MEWLGSGVCRRGWRCEFPYVTLWRKGIAFGYFVVALWTAYTSDL